MVLGHELMYIDFQSMIGGPLNEYMNNSSVTKFNGVFK